MRNDMDAAEWAKEKYINRFINIFTPTALIEQRHATPVSIAVCNCADGGVNQYAFIYMAVAY